MSKVLRLIKRTSHTVSKIKEDYETIAGKSMTVQDDAMTVQELLQRMTEIKPTFEKDGEDADFDDPDLMKIGRADVNSQMRIHAEQVKKVVSAQKRIKEAEDERVKREKEKEKSEKP